MTMLFLSVLGVVLLAVAIFALQNAQAITIRFLAWQLESSVAIVTLAAAAAGVVIAGMLGLAGRLRRLTHSRAATHAMGRTTLPAVPQPAGYRFFHRAR